VAHSSRKMGCLFAMCCQLYCGARTALDGPTVWHDSDAAALDASCEAGSSHREVFAPTVCVVEHSWTCGETSFNVTVTCLAGGGSNVLCSTTGPSSSWRDLPVDCGRACDAALADVDALCF